MFPLAAVPVSEDKAPSVSSALASILVLGFPIRLLKEGLRLAILLTALLFRNPIEVVVCRGGEAFSNPRIRSVFQSLVSYISPFPPGS